MVAALRDLGFLNAGTPLEMASTPVSAADPEENDLASRNTSDKPVSADSACRSKLALCACRSAPVKYSTKPVMIIAKIEKMNAYTGIAKAEPGLPDPAQVQRGDRAR